MLQTVKVASNFPQRPISCQVVAYLLLYEVPLHHASIHDKFLFLANVIWGDYNDSFFPLQSFIVLTTHLQLISISYSKEHILYVFSPSCICSHPHTHTYILYIYESTHTKLKTMSTKMSFKTTDVEHLELPMKCSQFKLSFAQWEHLLKLVYSIFCQVWILFWLLWRHMYPAIEPEQYFTVKDSVHNEGYLNEITLLCGGNGTLKANCHNCLCWPVIANTK